MFAKYRLHQGCLRLNRHSILKKLHIGYRLNHRYLPRFLAHKTGYL
ncbi:hypothetical protein L581_1571 [Serratia fonticola AU-AP2C]|nr:hypothetical protein L581_1571 [Serratia fonticola AU-AP2C]